MRRRAVHDACNCGELEDRIAGLEATIARLASALGAPVAAAPFTSHHAGPRPDGIGLRAWQRIAPTIPGAVRRGRYWLVSREAFAAWERSALAPLPQPANDAAEEWTPAKALAAVGLRASR